MKSQCQSDINSRKRTHSITTANEQQKKLKNDHSRINVQRNIPAFLNKLYSMVEDISTNDLIRWSNDNVSFIIEKQEEFARTVLPRFYKHNTFASFVRQLNMYNFHKIPHIQQGVLLASMSPFEFWEFSHPNFQRARPDLLVLVTRQNAKDKEEHVGLETCMQEIRQVKETQSIITHDLKELHRDNDILWQETLATREKYQNHQEAIQKVLEFLGAIFNTNNASLLPRHLIQEASLLTCTNETNQSQQQQIIQELQHKQDLMQPISKEAVSYATKSAQLITQDINALQDNIESLAAILGIDPLEIQEDDLLFNTLPHYPSYQDPNTFQ